MRSAVGLYGRASYWFAIMARNEHASSLLDKVLAISRNAEEQLSDGDVAVCYSLMQIILPHMATHWHFLKNGKKRNGCSIYTSVRFPVGKLGNASMNFNVNMKLPSKIGEEKVTSVVEKLFAGVKQKAEEEAIASPIAIDAGIKELGL